MVGRKSIIVVFTGVSAAALAAAAYAKALTPWESAPAAPAPDRPALVQEAHFAPDRASRSFVATIRPRTEADQAFRVGGKVAQRLVDVGQNVTAGQAVARLDDTDLRLQKEQAEAELTASRTALEQAAGDERRGGELHAKGWTSQAVYDRQRAAAEEARGRYRRAQRALELAGNALGYATLRADADGVVTATPVESGQVISAGQPVIRLARRGEIEASASLPETFISQAREGKARLVLWAQPGRIYEARLREMSPAADPATRTFAARFSLPGADAAVALGMSATLVIEPAHVSSVARAPLSALLDRGHGPAVWTVGADGTVILKPVRIARYEGADAVIAEGVAEGDRIVILGAQKLEAGQKVRPITQLAF